MFIGSRSLVYGAQQTQPPVSNALVPPVLYLTETTPSTPTVTPRPGRHHVLTPRPKNNTIYPCTCGVFLSSQFKKGSPEPPKGAPVLRHEQDKVFPCTPLGIRQCQNKCLEAVSLMILWIHYSAVIILKLFFFSSSNIYQMLDQFYAVLWNGIATKKRLTCSFRTASRIG